MPKISQCSLRFPNKSMLPFVSKKAPENLLSLHRFISIVHGNKANGVSTSIICSTTVLSPNVREIPKWMHYGLDQIDLSS